MSEAEQSNQAEPAPAKALSPKEQARQQIARRKRSRTLAMQALYQWQLTKTRMQEVEIQFLSDNPASEFDVAYFSELLQQIEADVENIDQIYAPLLSRSLESVDPIEKSILRLACYELAKRLDIPYRVVINEAVDLAKKFGGEDGHRFVNGILHKLSLELRKIEKQGETDA